MSDVGVGQPRNPGLERRLSFLLWRRVLNTITAELSARVHEQALAGPGAPPQHPASGSRESSHVLVICPRFPTLQKLVVTVSFLTVHEHSDEHVQQVHGSPETAGAFSPFTGAEARVFTAGVVPNPPKHASGAWTTVRPQAPWPAPATQEVPSV